MEDPEGLVLHQGGGRGAHLTAPEAGSMRAMQSVSQMFAHTSPSTHSSSFSAFTACPPSVTCAAGPVL